MRSVGLLLVVGAAINECAGYPASGNVTIDDVCVTDGIPIPGDPGPSAPRNIPRPAFLPTRGER